MPVRTNNMNTNVKVRIVRLITYVYIHLTTTLGSKLEILKQYYISVIKSIPWKYRHISDVNKFTTQHERK
jgi:hypothetical protein